MKLLILLSLIFLSACDPSNLNVFFEEPAVAIEEPIELPSLPLQQYVALFGAIDFNNYVPRGLITFSFVVNLIYFNNYVTPFSDRRMGWIFRFEDGHELFVHNVDVITYVISYRETDFQSIYDIPTWFNLGWGAVTIGDRRLFWHEGIIFFRINQR